MDMTTRYFGAPIKRNEDPRLLRGRALFVDDVEFSQHAACRVPAQRGRPWAHPRVSTSRRRGRGPASSRSIRRPISATTGSRGRLLVPPPPIAGITFNQRTQVPLATRQGAPCRRAARDRDRAQPPCGGRRARRHRGRYRAVAGGGRSRKGARRVGSASVHDDRTARTSPPMCARPRATMRPRWRRPPMWCGGASSTTAAPRRRSRPAASWRTGTPRPISSPCGTPPRRRCSCAAGLPRMLGLSERQVRVIAPVRGRRLRPQDHAVLSGGGGAAVGGDAARTPDQMDRGPQGAFLRHHP